MSHRVPFTPIVAGLPATIPFVGPEAIERRRGARDSRCGSGANESAFGVSPRAAEAMREALAQVSWYGDPEAFELRTEIAARHGVGVDNVCVAGGIDELLGLTVRMLIERGTPVVSSLGAYPTFNYQVAGFGGELHAVPYRDDHIDLDALVDRVRRTRAPLVYLANPDNPMGTRHDAGPVAEFIAALPEDCVLVLDEAYGQFAPAECEARRGRRQSARDSDAHLLQGAWDGGSPNRLRDRSRRDYRRIQQDQEPFRGKPGRAGGSARVVAGSGLRALGGGAGSGGARGTT